MASSTPPTAVIALTGQWVLDNMLPGLPLETSDGAPLSDALIDGRIKSVVASFQRKYGIRLAPTVIKVGTEPLTADPGVGAPLQISERYRGLDYMNDGNFDNRHHSMKLPIGPVRAILGIGIILPGMSRPADLPIDWISFQPRSNLIRLYPKKTLSFAAVMYTGGWFVNMLGASRTIPESWHVTYEAGYGPDDLTGLDYDILEALGKMVAIELLVPGSLDRFLAEGVGGKTISADGLSQSIQLLQHAGGLKFANVILRLTEELAEWERMFWARRGGVRIGIL